MNSIFFNESGRLKSGWRFLIFLFSFSFFSTLLAAGVVTLLSTPGAGGASGTNSLRFLFAAHFLSFLCAAALGWLCGKFLENLPFRALGWTFSNDWLKHLVLGLACGTFAILLSAAIAYLFGGLTFRWNSAVGSSAIWVTLVVSLIIFIVGALSEETLFRGYMLQTFSRSGLAWFAIALTSIFFASVHLNNPNANGISSLNTGLAGILFGIAYLKTRTLWFPFGLHLTWNWVQGAFLGITVSGLKELTTAPLLQPQDYGPIWLTGGEYGIEGGLACTAALIITMLLIWFLPVLKPTAEMLSLTDQENPASSRML